MQTDLKEQLDRLELKFDLLNRLLTGNGHPEKGLIVRVDRLEQEQQTQRRIGAFIVALVAAMGAWVASPWKH